MQFWQDRKTFKAFASSDLNNGLTKEESATLVRTPHVDQAIALILRGLLRAGGATAPKFSA
jgi:hypothetical protein